MTARFTPYEAVFTSTHYEAERFPAIRAEAAAHGRNVGVPDEILMLQSAGTTLRELPPETGSASIPPASALHEYGALLFQAFRYWSWGHHTLVLDGALARHLIELDRPLGEWTFSPPHPAGYLQLPRHLLWARVDEAAVPEPIDGFFWSVSGVQDQPPWRRLDLLFILGLRAERPGFSVIEIAVALPCDAPGHWGDLRVREGEPDFANVLPGGEIQGYHSIVSVAEALKLVSRTFHYIETQPGSVAAAGPSEKSGAAASQSRFAASLVTLSTGG